MDVWQSTLSRAISGLGRVLCHSHLRVSQGHTSSASRPAARPGMLASIQTSLRASDPVTQGPGRRATCISPTAPRYVNIVKRLGLGLGRDWGLRLRTGIGAWDWGLWMGTGIGDWGLGTGDGDLGLGMGTWDWGWGLGT